MATPNQRVERKLAAIFAADVAGYARLVESDEVGTLRLFTAHPGEYALTIYINDLVRVTWP
jgi:hypothetical protein